MRAPRARRSELATPASSEKMCAKSATSGADLVFLDLEDACAPVAKEGARSIAVAALTEQDWGRTVRAVRINGVDTPWCHGDIIEVVTGARDSLDVLIVPKARSARDVWWVDVLLTQLETKLGMTKRIGLEVLIEEAEGLHHALEIAQSSDRLEAIIFGAGDLSASLKARVDGNFDPVGDYPGDFWHFARVQVLAAARAAGIAAIDAPFPAYQDPDGYRRSATHASLLGFDGKWCIHPGQIPIANEVFAPTEEEVARARAAIETYRSSEAEGVGAIGQDGRLVDAAHMRLAENTLHQASLADGEPGMTSSSLRVVQWATGNIGTRSLQGVIDHPDLELVGVWVHGEDKAGRDAGDLGGRATTGVVATSDVDEIVALGADCVLYMPNACDFDVVCRLLEAGSNVVTTRGEFHRPASLAPEQRERVEAACAAGGTSIHSTGSSPGFISEAIPLVVTSIQRRLDLLTIDEFADLSKRDSPELLFEVMGFGQLPSAFDERRLDHLRNAFGPSLQVVAEALSIPLDSVEALGEVAVAPRPIEIAAGTIPTGTVAAQRTSIVGIRDGQPLLRFRATWYCGTDLDPAWDLLDTGWRVSVEGDAPLEIDLRMPIPLERMAETTPGYTANRAVNSVAAVCAAPPGIRTTPELVVIAKLA